MQNYKMIKILYGLYTQAKQEKQVRIYIDNKRNLKLKQTFKRIYDNSVVKKSDKKMLLKYLN